MLVAGNERGGGASHLLALSAACHDDGERAFYFLVVGRGYLQERLSQTGVDCLILDGGMRQVAGNLIRFLRDEKTRRPLQRIFLHAHGPRMNVLACFAAKRSGVAWTSTLHSDPATDFLPSRFKTLLFARLNVSCLRRATAIFAVNQELVSIVPGKPVFTVRNGALLQANSVDEETSRQRLRSQLGISSESFVIGMAVRLVPVKDIPTALRALALLDHPDVHLAIAGDGPMRAELEQLRQDLNLVQRVHFLGFLSPIGDFLAGLDIHVMSSVSEGTGLSILEAGYYGVPNVGTDIAGIRQLITDNETGFLFPAGDAQALADAWQRLFVDSVLRKRLAEAFKSRVLPLYAPRAMLDSYRTGYEQLEV